MQEAEIYFGDEWHSLTHGLGLLYRDQKEELAARRHEIVALRGELVALRGELEALRGELEAIRGADEVAVRDAEIAERDAEIAELKIHNLRLSEELSEALTSIRATRARLERAERLAAALDEEAVAARSEYRLDRDRAAARIVCLHGQLVEHGHVPNDEYDEADTVDDVYRLKYADLKAEVDAVAEAIAWHMKPHGKRAKQMPRRPAAARGSIAALWAVAETLATAVPAPVAARAPDAPVAPLAPVAPPVSAKQKKRTVASMRAATQAAAKPAQPAQPAQAAAPASPQPPLDMLRAIGETLNRLHEVTAITGAAADYKGPLSHRDRRAVIVATKLLLQYSERAKNPDDPSKCIPGVLLATCPLAAVRVWDMEDIKSGKGGKIAREAIASLDDGSAQAAGKYLLGLQAFAGVIGGDTAMHSVLLAERRTKNPITGAAISLLVSALGEGAPAPKHRDAPAPNHRGAPAPNHRGAPEPCRGEGAPEPCRGKDAPKLGEDAPKLGEDAPKLGEDAPKLGEDAPKLGKDAPKLGEDAPKLRDDADLLNCYVIARVKCTGATVG